MLRQTQFLRITANADGTVFAPTIRSGDMLEQAGRRIRYCTFRSSRPMPESIIALLMAVKSGSREGLDAVLPVVNEELWRLAAELSRNAHPGR